MIISNGCVWHQSGIKRMQLHGAHVPVKINHFTKNVIIFLICAIRKWMYGSARWIGHMSNAATWL